MHEYGTVAHAIGRSMISDLRGGTQRNLGWIELLSFLRIRVPNRTNWMLITALMHLGLAQLLQIGVVAGVHVKIVDDVAR